MAMEFAAFCQRNPKPCPIIGMGAPGDPSLPDLGDIDIRTDVPRYRVFKDGKLVDEPTDIRNYWSDDLVTFVIGCSFSFEKAILDEGIRLQHVARNTTVPMYRTNIDCVPAGRFRGKMVVSMRPFVPADAIRAVQITSRFPAVHGAPVHIGLPEAIGIADLARPDWGDAAEIRRRRAAGVLGLRSDAAGGRRGGAAVDLHHPQAGLDADHRPPQRPARRHLKASALECPWPLAASSPCDEGRSAGLRHARGGGLECHEFSSPISQRSANTTGELSSMAFQVGV